MNCSTHSSLPQSFQKNCFDPPSSPYDLALEKRQQFHKKVINVFSSLPSKGKLKEIATRCIILVIAPFVYLKLAWQIHKKKNYLLLDKDVNINLELNRLSNVNSTAEASFIDTTINTLSKNRDHDFFKVEREKQMKIIMSQALELKKIHEKDHLVITHSQDSRWYVVSQLIKILVQKYDPQNTAPAHFEFLRSTKHKPAMNIEAYKQKLLSGVNDHDLEIRTTLISSDLYFWSAVQNESALDFFSRNRSILTAFNPTPMKNAIEIILKEYLPKNISAQKITTCAQKILDLSQKINTYCGQLFVICIPKANYQNLNEIGFLSHAWGVPCYCHQNQNEVVNKLQQGESVQCRSGPAPQFRLSVDKITPSHNVKSFLLNTLTTKLKKEIHTEISDALLEAAL